MVTVFIATLFYGTIYRLDYYIIMAITEIPQIHPVE